MKREETMENRLKEEILEKTKEYFQLVHEKKDAGTERINYAGRVFDEREIVNLVDASLDFWLTYGDYSKLFEKNLAEYLGVRWSFLVNSGSSANLLAFFALTSPLLEARRINRGDEVITVAAGFPTTVAPIVQYGAVPVFVDVELQTGNIDTTQLEAARSEKTKAVMLAHTLGNPFKIDAVKAFCDKHNLWLIEDNCDALGSKYQDRYTGTFGDIGTSSFYPPHHMTMGEGGAVYTSNPLLKKIILSMRDWGRDCWCDSGIDNTCGARFSQQFGTLPLGYDHKYVYSHFGFNLKVTDMQAAIGVAQLEKLDGFTQRRRNNFDYLYKAFSKWSEFFILPQPYDDASPSWFGFLVTLQEGVPFERNQIVGFLEKNNIQTRNLFAGNLVRQPLFQTLIEEVDYRVVGQLDTTDRIMKDSFWLGVYPGLDEHKLDYIIETVERFIASVSSRR